MVPYWYLSRMQTALTAEYHRICLDPASHQPLAYLRLRQAIRNVVQQRDAEPGHALPSASIEIHVSTSLPFSMR